jgi:hypothetical protein
MGADIARHRLGVVHRVEFKHLQIPVGSSVVQIWLTDGAVGVEDPDGESYYDGWATVDDIASALVKWTLLDPEAARAVADEAIARWIDWLGDKPHRYPTG